MTRFSELLVASLFLVATANAQSDSSPTGWELWQNYIGASSMLTGADSLWIATRHQDEPIVLLWGSGVSPMRKTLKKGVVNVLYRNLWGRADLPLGSILAGTNTGVTVLKPNEISLNSWQDNFTPTTGFPKELEKKNILALAEEGGKFWIGTDDGLYVSADARSLKRLTKREKDEDQDEGGPWLPDDSKASDFQRINVIFRQELRGEVHLWIGTDCCLFRYLNGGFRKVTASDLPRAPVTAIGALENHLLVGYRAVPPDQKGGLWQIGGLGSAHELLGASVNFIQLQRGVLWIATDGGVFTYNGSIARFGTNIDTKFFKQVEGRVVALGRDPNGGLWLGAPDTLVVYRESSLSVLLQRFLSLLNFGPSLPPVRIHDLASSSTEEMPWR